MFTIIQILRRGDIRDIPRLKEEILQHHMLFIIHFPRCLKPKLHYIFHVPECWEKWQSLISCYGAESDHRDVTRIFRFAMSNPSSTAIYHAVHHLFDAAARDKTYEEVFLMQPVPCNKEFPVGGQRRTATAMSRQLQAGIGIFKVGDCLIWKNDGTRQCGKALFFLQFPRAQDIRVDCVCVVRRFDKLEDGWWHDHGTNVFVSAVAVDFTVVFAQIGQRIMPLLPNL